METTSSLRRRAELCLRLSEFCSDEVLANDLQFMAAEYHQRALRSEFGLRDDCESTTSARSIVRH
jgi:hypothetical protein